MITTMLLALSLGLQSQHINDYQFEGGFSVADSGRIDALCIVSPVRRKETDDGDRVADEATVVASSGFSAGDSVQIVLNARSRAKYPFRILAPGRKYLVLAFKQRDGKLVSFSAGGDPAEDIRIPARASNEISGMAAFETHKTSLSEGDNAREVLFNSIVDCLEGADRETARQVCECLTWTRPPGFAAADGRGQRDFPLSLRVRGVALNSPPEQRAYMYLALNAWRVYGTADLYLEAIEDCASDPSAFDDVPAIQENTYYENLGADGSIPADFRHHYSSERWAKALLATKNPKVFRFLVENGYVEPGSKYEPQIAAMLNRKEPWVRASIVWCLAGARNDMVHVPKEIGGPRTGETEADYPNLDEMVAYWKKKMGVTDKGG